MCVPARALNVSKACGAQRHHVDHVARAPVRPPRESEFVFASLRGTYYMPSSNYRAAAFAAAQLSSTSGVIGHVCMVTQGACECQRALARARVCARRTSDRSARAPATRPRAARATHGEGPAL